MESESLHTHVSVKKKKKDRMSKKLFKCHIADNEGKRALKAETSFKNSAISKANIQILAWETFQLSFRSEQICATLLVTLDT